MLNCVYLHVVDVFGGSGKHMFVELFFLIPGAVYLFDLASKLDFSGYSFGMGYFYSGQWRLVFEPAFSCFVTLIFLTIAYLHENLECRDRKTLNGIFSEGCGSDNLVS